MVDLDSRHNIKNHEAKYQFLLLRMMKNVMYFTKRLEKQRINIFRL